MEASTLTLPPPVEAARPPYYPISPLKLVLLSLATFGVFTIWWFYEQWRHVRRATGDPIQPAWRALFANLFCFSLFNRVEADLRVRSMRLPLPAAALGVLFFVTVVAQRLPDPYWLIGFLHVVPVAVVQVAIARLLRASEPAFAVDTRFGFGSGVVVTLGAICWAAVLIGLIMPDTRVRQGDEMKASEIAYLHEKGYLRADEEVLYFSSSGVWSIHEDGNLLTDARVVSYGNQDGIEYHASAAYEEIYSVDAVYADSWLDDTMLTVTTRDGEEIYLIVSSEEGQDRTFVRRLESEWRERVPEGEEELRVPDPDEEEDVPITA